MTFTTLDSQPLENTPNSSPDRFFVNRLKRNLKSPYKFQNKHVQEASSGAKNSTYSLNNVNDVATGSKQAVNADLQRGVSWVAEAVSVHTEGRRNPNITKGSYTHNQNIKNFFGEFDLDESKSNLRDQLDALIREKSDFDLWSNEYWNFIKLYQSGSIDKKLVKNTKSNIFKILDFTSCHWKYSKGFVRPMANDLTKVYFQKKYCHEKYCPECEQKKRLRVSMERIDTLKAVVEGQKENFPGFLFLDFTLAEKIEALPLNDRKMEKKVVDAIHSIVREMFGRWKRSNIGVYFDIHPIGSSDLFRDRWHCHVLVIPAEITTQEQERIFKVEHGQFFWLLPSKVSREKGHLKNNWKIDLEWLQNIWTDKLQKIFKNDISSNQAEVTFIPYDEKSGYWYHTLKKERQKPVSRGFKDIFWSKMAHKIKYNSRSFSKDFMDSVLRSSMMDRELILKGEKGDFGHWQKVSISDYIDRLTIVRGRNRLLVRGFLRYLDDYEKKGFIILLRAEADEGERPDVLPWVPAKISYHKKKVKDQTNNKWVWENVRQWSWECPVTKERREYIPEENLMKWKWN